LLVVDGDHTGKFGVFGHFFIDVKWLFRS